MLPKYQGQHTKNIVFIFIVVLGIGGMTETDGGHHICSHHKTVIQSYLHKSGSCESSTTSIVSINILL